MWNAVAEVSGQIINIRPQLANGAVIAPGEPLVRIDARSIELTLAQLDAENSELNVQESNAQAALLVEQRNLALTKTDLVRRRKAA